MAARIKIDKNTLTAKKNGAPVSRPRTKGRSRPRRRAPEREGDTGQILAIVAGVLVVILIMAAAISAAASASRKKSKRYRTTTRTVAGTTRNPSSKPRGPHRYKELDGMTMKEWMDRHNQDNDMLRSRKDRVNTYEKSGQAPAK